MDSSSSTSKEASGASTGSPKQKDSNGCDMVGPTCYLSTAHNVGIDETSPLSTQREDQTKNARMAGKVYRHHKRTRRTSSREKDVAPSTVSEKVKTETLFTSGIPIIMFLFQRRGVKQNCKLNNMFQKISPSFDFQQ